MHEGFVQNSDVFQKFVKTFDYFNFMRAKHTKMLRKFRYLD